MITKTLIIDTEKSNQMINITREINDILHESNVREGIVTLFVPHTTAAVTINENADPDVKIDMMFGLNKISPDRAEYIHGEGNSDAHIKSSLVGASETIIVHQSKMVLGIWQGIYFCEFDGPRRRKIIIRIS